MESEFGGDFGEFMSLVSPCVVARNGVEFDEFGKPFAAGAVHPHRLGGELICTLRHRGAAAVVAVAAVDWWHLWHP